MSLQPKVSVIVTAFLAKSKPYLDVCMRSLSQLDYNNFEIIIVSPGTYAIDLAREYKGKANVVSPDWPYTNAEACNYGVTWASADSEYYLITNDDCVFTKHSLTELVNSSKACSDNGVFMPIGNDTNLNMYALNVGVAHGPAKLEQWAPILDQMIQVSSPYPIGMIFARTLCLYAVLIPRRVFELVGALDGSRKGHDDTDYTLRVTSHGMVNALCLSSIVYHFGGVTADQTYSAKDRQESLDSFKEKWGMK